MRILVTGGAGYIGSHVVVEALTAGHDVISIDSHVNSDPSVYGRVERIAGRGFATAQIDLRNAEAVREVMAAFEPEAILHLAALKAVGESVAEPLAYYENNVGGALSLLKAMRAEGVGHIVFSSSATVYGEPAYLPINEAHPLAPTNPYGWTKLHVEQILKDLAQAGALRSVALLRYFNPVGAHPSGLIGEAPTGAPNNLMPYVAQVAAGLRPELTVFGDDYDTPDGTGVRDYIHVVDLARAHIAALERLAIFEGCDTFNLGAGRGASVMEMIRAFERVSGRRIPLRIAPRRSGDVAACYADPSRAAARLDWRAALGIDAMCRDAWRWQSKTAAPGEPPKAQAS